MLGNVGTGVHNPTPRTRSFDLVNLEFSEALCFNEALYFNEGSRIRN